MQLNRYDVWFLPFIAVWYPTNLTSRTYNRGRGAGVAANPLCWFVLYAPWGVQNNPSTRLISHENYLITLKAMQEKNFCLQGNHYINKNGEHFIFFAYLFTLVLW